jgi:hypothetical protein
MLARNANLFVKASLRDFGQGVRIACVAVTTVGLAIVDAARRPGAFRVGQVRGAIAWVADDAR